tara:strand:+ start:2032 stop:2766 length:735 start_codon:yes stop_codon:yes gene_type:complete
MSKESLEGCPRCDDYDKIKDELESNKRKSQEEQKNALKRCEESKKQLQKKLITIGVAAIIAGTILGKEFVDKIADYIDSFNKVKDTANQLISKADISTPPPSVDSEPEEVIDDAVVVVPAPTTRDITGWPAVPTIPDYGSPLTDMITMGSGSGSFLQDVLMESMQPSLETVFDDPIDAMSLVSAFTIDELTTPFYIQPFDIPSINPERYEAGLYSVPVVPEASSAIPLLFGAALVAKTRRPRRG